ncbi:MAG: sugar phosphate nucleotidyltransferase [Candidatus Methanoperedens sp.]|nr:sugar phosphate nucleotidyltransferase [Candidatus Methanoperedens sp.]CAG1009621.1 bifunctional UDP-N-acetylglucosamine pyrophosphorylase / Glucosamine-1-phosphate N-acetyltransferase [Methanosarcinales archaeon]
MKAIILAAGQGTRMGPLTRNIPKVMLPIANKPLLLHVIISARDAGIREFVLVVGYGEKIIKDYFKNGALFDVSIEYVHQEKQMGTADAVSSAKGMVGDRFLVLNGDIIVNPAHIKKLIGCGFDVVMTARHVDNPSDYGVLQVQGKKVLRIIEKPLDPPTNLANAGIYVFPSSIFDTIGITPLSIRKEYEITDSLQMLIDKGIDVGFLTLADKWMDIGKPWDLLDANEYFLSGLQPDVSGKIEPFATLKGSVSVGEGTIIRNGSYIIGPVIFGKNCDIGPNCYIRPGTSIGDNVRIGNAVEIKNSIIMKGTHIGHLSYVGDSIIGERCNFGAGTKVANLRHDERTIRVTLKGKLIDSGRRKLGTIMGDDVHTGINSMINVGAVVESKAMIAPGKLVE